MSFKIFQFTLMNHNPAPFYVHNYILPFSPTTEKMENIDLVLLVEKNLYWLEKNFGGQYACENAESRRERRRIP